MPTIRELTTVFNFKLDTRSILRYNTAIGDAQRKTQKLTGNIDKMARSIRNAGVIMTAVVTAPLAFLTKGLITAASDAEEQGQKFRVVFRDIRKEADAIAKSFAKDFGVAGSTSRQLLGDTADLLSGFGFTQKAALKLSNKVQRLAGDLASFQNIQGGVAEAGTRITKGILGETENLKLLGIVVNQGTKEFIKRNKEIAASEKVTIQQAKALTILEQAFIQSKNAIGDFNRTRQQFANQARILSENIKDLKESFGVLLIPIALKTVKVLLSLVEFLRELPTPIKKLVLFVAALSAILGPLILVVGLLGQAFLGIIALITGKAVIIAGIGVAFKSLVAVIAAIVTPITLAIAAIAAVLFFFLDDLAVWMKDGDSILGAILGSWKDFKSGMSQLWDDIVAGFDGFIMAFTGDFQGLTDSIELFAGSIVFFISDLIEDILSLFGLGEESLKGFREQVENFQQLISKAVKGVGKGLQIASDFTVNTIHQISDKLSFGGDSFNRTSSGLITDRGVVLDAVSGGGGRGNTKVNSTVNVTVPPGTPEDQAQALGPIVKRAVNETMSDIFDDTLSANPAIEEVSK